MFDRDYAQLQGWLLIVNAVIIMVLSVACGAKAWKLGQRPSWTMPGRFVVTIWLFLLALRMWVSVGVRRWDWNAYGFWATATLAFLALYSLRLLYRFWHRGLTWDGGSHE